MNTFFSTTPGGRGGAIINDNIDRSHLGKDKFHLNRRGGDRLMKNFKSFIQEDSTTHFNTNNPSSKLRSNKKRSVSGSSCCSDEISEMSEMSDLDGDATFTTSDISFKKVGDFRGGLRYDSDSVGLYKSSSDIEDEYKPYSTTEGFNYKWISTEPETETESKYGITETKYGLSEPKYGISESKYGGSESKYGNSESKYGNSESKYGLSESKYGNSESKYGNSESKYGNSDSKYGISESKYGSSESKYGNSESKYGNSTSNVESKSYYCKSKYSDLISKYSNEGRSNYQASYSKSKESEFTILHLKSEGLKDKYLRDDNADVQSPYKEKESPYKMLESPYKASETPYKVSESPYKATESPYKASETSYKVTESPYSTSDRWSRYSTSGDNGTTEKTSSPDDDQETLYSDDYIDKILNKYSTNEEVIEPSISEENTTCRTEHLAEVKHSTNKDTNEEDCSDDTNNRNEDEDTHSSRDDSGIESENSSTTEEDVSNNNNTDSSEDEPPPIVQDESPPQQATTGEEVEDTPEGSLEVSRVDYRHTTDLRQRLQPVIEEDEDDYLDE